MSRMETATLKRHDLLDLTDGAREAILEELTGAGTAAAAHRDRYARILLPEQAGARIPGIVRREEGSAGRDRIPVGFSSPLAGREGRLRIAAFVHPDQVVRITSPFELLSAAAISVRTPCMQALEIAGNHARPLGLALGVWGSAALELYTGLPCTHRDSDLDLLVRPACREVLSRFLTEIGTIEQQLGLRIDVELAMKDGYGVQLKELFGQGRTILGKSLANVALLCREQILAELPQEPFPQPSEGGIRRAYG